ncbi:hypothetical protein [Nonlabens antarcticus]|uniref:hypothetical protein n=1 Tax=Nonlabens antarcticus TaxID=392714 RepID=UPI001890D016|nr:hypothetical protein [Nonlabens antarcticus]
MKYLYLSAMLVLTLVSCSQENDCSDLKTGNFIYTGGSRPEIIVRTETSQIETNPVNNIVVTSSIKWTSDCSYEMTYTNIENYPGDVSSVIGKKINCDIIKVQDSLFVVKAKSDIIDSELQFIKLD